MLLILAMTAMPEDGLTGSAWGDWANYTASPLRAFENELGVQAPVGFWDPAGFTADGSVEDFKRRRATEIKHGRISMLATMGYITPSDLDLLKLHLRSFQYSMFLLTFPFLQLHFIVAESIGNLFLLMKQSPGDHWQIPWLLISICRFEVRRCA